jgi:transposase-like protein
MITQGLHCPYCHGTAIVRHGLSPEGKQRYRCCACHEGRGRIFLLEDSYAGPSLAVKQQIVAMAMNARGMRATARVLQVSPTTRTVKIFELAFPREVTPRPSPAPWLVFCSTLPHTGVPGAITGFYTVRLDIAEMPLMLMPTYRQ